MIYYATSCYITDSCADFDDSGCAGQHYQSKAMFRFACAVPRAKTIFHQDGSHNVAHECRESVYNDILRFLEEVEEGLW